MDNEMQKLHIVSEINIALAQLNERLRVAGQMGIAVSVNDEFHSNENFEYTEIQVYCADDRGVFGDTR